MISTSTVERGSTWWLHVWDPTENRADYKEIGYFLQQYKLLIVHFDLKSTIAVASVKVAKTSELNSTDATLTQTGFFVGHFLETFLDKTKDPAICNQSDLEYVRVRFNQALRGNF